MNTPRTYLMYLLAVFFAACAGNTDNEEAGARHDVVSPADKVFHEVMEGHDAGMAKVGRLRKYSQELAHRIDSIKTTSNSTSNLAELQRVKDSLDNAQAAMFQWMEGFRADTLIASMEQRIQYLEAQKASVLLVRNRIMNSIQLYDSLRGK